MSLIIQVMEKKGSPLISQKEFILRMLKHLIIALLLIMFSLLIGIAGYMSFAGLKLVDALLNASMILAGMGPVDIMISDEAKLFASFFAIYSGLIFLTITAIIISPVVHRILHKFHVEDELSEE